MNHNSETSITIGGLETKTTYIYHALLETLNSLRIAFPTVGPAFNDIINALQENIKHSDYKQSCRDLGGRGHNALFLKDLHKVFPEKQLDKLVENGLPKVYQRDGHHELRELCKYINYTLKEYIGHTLNGWKVYGGQIESPQKWFGDKTPEQLRDFLGNFYHETVLDDVHLNVHGWTGDIATGFYHYHSAYHSDKVLAVVLNTGSTIVIIKTKPSESHSLYVKVPIENKMVSTILTQYIDFEEVTRVYNDLLHRICLENSTKLTKDTFCQELFDKVIESGIPESSENELEEFLKYDKASIEIGHVKHIYDIEHKRVLWHTTKFQEGTTTIILFKTRHHIFKIHIQNFENQEIRYNFDAGITEFDCIPIQTRKKLRKMFLEVIENHRD